MYDVEDGMETDGEGEEPYVYEEDVVSAVEEKNDEVTNGEEGRVWQALLSIVTVSTRREWRY